MKNILFILLFSTAYASPLPLTPFPIFLKIGYSSVLEFDNPPTKIILGDGSNFQVEKLDNSLVLRTLASSATSNLFVYLKSGEVRLFTLTASEEAIPTHYKEFKKAPIPKPTKSTPAFSYKKGARLISAKFDTKKDFLTVEVSLTADSKESITPNWEWVDLRQGREVFKAKSTWAEREVIQKDSTVKARFTFLRPNISRKLTGTILQIPVKGYASPIQISLKGGLK